MGVDATFSVLRKHKFAILKQISAYYDAETYRYMLELPFNVLYKQKTRWNSDIQNFYSEILNFRLF